MLGERLVGHELSHQQSIIAFAAASYQIRQTLAPQAPHRFRLLEEILRIGPRAPLVAFDGDGAAVLELASVDGVAGASEPPAAGVPHDVLRRESARRGLELLEAELGEARARFPLAIAPVLAEIGGRRRRFEGGRRSETWREAAEGEFGATTISHWRI